jgi:pilus assembly protein CpaB
MSIFKNRTVVGVICILVSLLICFGVTPLFNRAVSEKTEIVRVVKEIKAGDEITKDMVQTTEVGGYGLPDNIVRETGTVIGNMPPPTFP